MSRTPDIVLDPALVGKIKFAARRQKKVVREKAVRPASGSAGKSKLDPFLSTVKHLKNAKGFNNQQVADFFTSNGVTASLGLVNNFCTRHGLTIRE